MPHNFCATAVELLWFHRRAAAVELLSFCRHLISVINRSDHPQHVFHPLIIFVLYHSIYPHFIPATQLSAMYAPPIVEMKSIRDMVASGIHTTMPEVLKAVLEHGDSEWDAKQLCYAFENMFYIAGVVGLKQARHGDSHFPPALREFVQSHFKDDLEVLQRDAFPVPPASNARPHTRERPPAPSPSNTRPAPVELPPTDRAHSQPLHATSASNTSTPRDISHPSVSAAPHTATGASLHRVVSPPTAALPSHHHIGHHPAQSSAELQTEEALKQERNEITKRESASRRAIALLSKKLESWRVKLAEEEARRKSCHQPSTSHLTSPDHLPPVLPHDLPPNLPESFINYLKKIWLSMDVIQEDLDFETRVTESSMQHLWDTANLLSDKDFVV
ncbi:hypothetical protein B0H21DRAFT_711936 [Amylocystis lapponica]|nr:hypothetical protein B0H21DRAFT_711936 [Amylocystis lapponica]